MSKNMSPDRVDFMERCSEGGIWPPRLTCTAAAARSGYLRAYVDCRHVCQNKKCIYGTDAVASVAQPKIARARDDD